MIKRHICYFFGHEVVIQVPESEKDKDWSKMFSDWFDREKANAVDDYKQSNFLDKLKKYE